MQFFQHGTHALLFFSILLSSNIFANIHACNQSERSSLLSFALTLSPPTPLNWISTDCCIWEGITCNSDGRVTHLQLPSKGLKFEGASLPSPSSLENLTHLTHLNLSHNSLDGSLQKTAGIFFLYLSRLEILDLSYNLLTGELPISLPSSNIQILDLSSNNFHGSVSASFFQHFRSLTSFNISNNTFTGSIPSSNICLHSNSFIEILDFSVNQFNGSLSHGLGKCSKLQVFRAGYNYLSGLLPQDIYNATKLDEISLPQNSFYGAIDERIVNCTNLKILDLNSNYGFSGKLPRSIGKLSKLEFLLLQFNYLNGSLPSSLMNCTNLIELRIGYNNFEGNISVLNFSKLSHLTKLDVGVNYFSGVFPVSLYSCKSLKAIEMCLNNIEGEIQPEILKLKSLSFLSLGYNRLTNITGAMKILMRCKTLTFLSFLGNFLGEEMPADIGMVDFDGFQNLRFLNFGGCQITGQIPIWLSRLRKLEVLLLNSNRITGSIPSWLGTLPRLFNLNLGSNLIIGEFPKELCGLPMLVSEKILPQTNESDLELPIYSNTASSFLQFKLSYLPRGIYLSSNTMNGNIPFEIGQLQGLHQLNLYNNSFSGHIPDQISNLKYLEVLELSKNHFSGKIPTSLKSLSFLKDLNVSNNNLEGSIPTGTQLQSFNASAFEGNPKLCGAPLARKCSPLKPNDGDINKDHVENVHQIPEFYISAALGFIVGFCGVCWPLVLRKKWDRRIEVFVTRMKTSFRS